MDKRVLGFLCVLGMAGQISLGQVEVGVGAKLFLDTSFAFAFIRYGRAGVELSFGTPTVSYTPSPGDHYSLTGLLYVIDGKIFLLSIEQFNIYVGAGGSSLQTTIVGAHDDGSYYSMSTTVYCLHLTGGIEVRLPPVAIFGGGDWVSFYAMGEYISRYNGGSFGRSLLGFGYYDYITFHLGIRYDF